MAEIKLEASWKQYLEAEFNQPYMQQLKKFLQEEKSQKKNYLS
jgi:uracil-DNA glycosylase